MELAEAVEVNTLPLRSKCQDLVKTYTDALLNSSSVTTYPLNARIANRAAELRAQFNLRTPDAIQIATAIIAKADAFITNDERLKKVNDLTILIVADYEASHEQK